MIRFGFCCVFSCMVVLCGVGCQDGKPTGSPSIIIGRVENVVMEDVGLKLKARIDTGTGVSSIHAKILKMIQSTNGEGEQVIFEIKDDKGTTTQIKRKVVDWMIIKGKGTNKEIRRPVVILDICLGGKRLEGRFNLADRSGFIYPVLVGRNLLKTGHFLINPRKKFMEHPGCSTQ